MLVAMTSSVRTARSVPAPGDIAVTTVYRVMRGDGRDLLIPAHSQDSRDVPMRLTSTLSLGIPLELFREFQVSLKIQVSCQNIYLELCRCVGLLEVLLVMFSGCYLDALGS